MRHIQIVLHVPVIDQTASTQELYLPSLAKTTSVRLEVETQ